MKRVVSLILIAVLGLSLCACGSDNASGDPVIGEWRSLTDFYYFFQEDYTGYTSEGDEFTWSYEGDLKGYTIVMRSGETFSSPIYTENGLRFLSFNNLRTYHSDDLMKLTKREYPGVS